MARNIISFYALFEDEFKISFYNDNGNILVYKNGYLCFKASPYNGIYESAVCVGRNSNITLNIDSDENVLDKSRLWHYRHGHINKNRIAKLQSEESWNHST